MDRHIFWLRREVARQLVKRAGAQFVVLAALFGGLGYLLGSAPWVSAGWALGLAQLVVLVRLGLSLVFGPLGERWLDGYYRRPLEFRTAPIVTEGQAAGLGLEPVVRAVADDAGVDLALYRTPDGSTLVAEQGPDGSLFAVSSLGDGRVLVTSALLLPPLESLLVNVNYRADAAEVVARHLAVVRKLTADGLPARPAHPRLVVDLVRRERDGYQLVGFAAAAFLALDGRRRPWQLKAVVAPRDLQRLARMAPRRAPRPQKPQVSAASRPVTPATIMG